MTFALWLTIAGVLLVAVTVSGSVLSRLPVSTSMLYLLVGLALGPLWLGLAAPNLLLQAPWFEQLTEVIVLLSLFSSGLKMSAGLHDRRWFLPLRLALGSMLVTVALVAAVGVGLLGLSIGAAVLLGGILAPTDPVLATDVQLSDPADRDSLRFALTGEGGLNDATAFPMVMLGLGLLGLHDIGHFGWRWLAVDVLWATAVAIVIGGALGVSVGKLVIYLRRSHNQAVGHDNFLALGLIGLAYGLTQLAHGYGFLAVFAAGLALRLTERRSTAAVSDDEDGGEREGQNAPPPIGEISMPADELATHPRHAPAYLAHAVLSFNEQLDRIGEVAGVIAIGMLLWAVPWQASAWWFVPLMLLVVRPASVAIGLAGARIKPIQRRLIGWFGIRGIGSLFYLAYAIHAGVAPELAGTLVALTLSVVVTSIVVHGISVTPLMALYGRRQRP